jgi:hypothetical protein
MKRYSDLKFDVSSIVEKAKNLPRPKVKVKVTVNLPFLSIELDPSNEEKKIAREVIIRLRDKRVLVAWECCDNCIDNAITSIREIRTLLVDKQVELQNDDSPLFLLFDLMLEGIRQFLTFTEKYDPRFNRDEYFGALEVLRGHLLRCIKEIAKIGDTSPKLNNRLEFDPLWNVDIYIIKHIVE